jgi:signal transduction histidine kinase
MVKFIISLLAWTILLLYLIYEYQEYGAELLSHLYSQKDNPAQFVFHIMIFLMPVVATYAAYLSHQKDKALKQRSEMREKLQEVILTMEGEKSKSAALIAGIGDAISIQDTYYKILYQNQVHKDLIGDHVGDCCYESYGGRDSVCEGCPVSMCFQDGNIHKAERSTIVDKGEIHVEVTASPLTNSSGEIIGGIEVVRDITERKRSEESLRHRTRGLVTLMEVSMSLAATLDLETVLQATTDGVTELFGLETAAVYLIEDNQLHLRATTPPLPPRFPEALRIAPIADHPHIRQAITSGVPVLVTDMTKADLTPAERSVTEERDLRTVIFIPLIAGVKSVGTLIVGSTGKPQNVSDIEIDLCHTMANLSALAVENARLYQSSQTHASELKQTLLDRNKIEQQRLELEQQLQHTQKLESLGVLAGGIAHDFNNMIQAILGYASILRMKKSDAATEEEFLDSIIQTSIRASELTNGLLAYSRKQTLNLKATDINDIIANTKKLLRRMIGEDIELETRLSSEELIAIVDTGQIQQVLTNLVTNARDSMPKGGSLTIASNELQVSEGSANSHVIRPGRYAKITVSDTGEGIDEALWKNIFEPFFTTKSVGKGTGLGLSIVYGIVVQHGGYIECDSSKGAGTTFTIYIPLTDSEKYQVTSSKEPYHELSGTETILLAEDNESVRGAIKAILESVGYMVIEASDGHDAIEQYRERGDSIDMLLLDVLMPKCNGKEAMEAIRQIDPDICVCFISGYSCDVISDRVDPGDDFQFISKPVLPDELLEKIRTILD